MIDTGSGGIRLESALESAGLSIKNVAQVVLTHCHSDHVGGLAEIVEKASPHVLACGYDASIIGHSCGIDVELLQEYALVKTELGPLRVLRTPGHTKGSICLYHAASKALFSGDTVFANGYFGKVELRDVDMLKSLERLAKLEVRLLFPGHGPWVEDGWHVKLALENAKLWLSSR